MAGFIKKDNMLFFIIMALFAYHSSAYSSSTPRSQRWTLDALLSTGVRDNPRVASGLATYSASQEDKNAAWQQYLPTPSIQTSTNSDGLEDTELSLSQPLWTAGRIEGSVDAASARADAAGVAVTEIQYNLALSVIDTFQRYIRSRARQDVLTQFGDRLKFYHARMSRRVSSGSSPANDSVLLDARIATNTAQLISAQEEEYITLGLLSQLTGIALSRDNIDVSYSLRSVPSLGHIMGLAEKYNPILVKMNSEISAAESDVRSARGTMLPSISLVAKHSIDHGNSSGRTNDSNVSVQFSFSPGPGISAFSRTKAAQERLYSLRMTRHAVLEELQVKVREDYERLRSVNNRQKENEINARSADAVLSSYERLFVAGKRSWQDVMNAARDLSDAKLVVADSEAERIGIRYRLDIYSAQYKWMTDDPEVKNSDIVASSALEIKQ